MPIALPARFAAGGRERQCVTRELGIQGVFLTCPQPPHAGTPIRLWLHLPDQDAPAEVNALVAFLETLRPANQPPARTPVAARPAAWSE